MTTKIAFVSCAYATRRPKQPAWQDILDKVPDLNLLLLLGDTAYMNWGDLPEDFDALNNEVWDFKSLNECYEIQFNIKSFRKLIAKVPTLAIWDDHDCGINDVCGAEFPEQVKKSRALFDHWMKFAVNAGRPEMYAVYDKLPDVRILMLDGRSERTLPTAVNPTMLGSKQEDWLWEQLSPASVQRPITILANGVGLSQGSPVEVVKAYTNFWDKLRKELSFRANPSGVTGDCGRRALFLAGDIHRNAFIPFEREPFKNGPLESERIYEVLSSGVACFIPKTYRTEQFTPDRYNDNWGLITIDEINVRIDFHGQPDSPGKKDPNNFTRVIRRSDWQVVP